MPYRVYVIQDREEDPAWRPLFSAAILREETLATADGAGQNSRSATEEKRNPA
jgi:hypothetical protein